MKNTTSPLETAQVSLSSFTCRSYTFQELAMLYSPTSTPQTASKTLSKWIRETRGLRESLEAKGWKPQRKLLSPVLVACIISFLGEP